MSIYYKHILSVLSLSLVAGGAATAQTVTVSKTGTINTIAGAIAQFASDSDPAPNVIQITDSEVYDEVITVDVPLTIEGTGSAKPVLAVQANASGRAGSSGLVVNLPSTMTTGSVFLKNLTVIPSRTAPPASSGINVFNNNAYVEIDGLLLTANNGSDAPVSTDGLTDVPENSAFTYFGDDGIAAGQTADGQFEGDGLELHITNTIITSLRDQNAAGNTNGIYVSGQSEASFRKTTIGDGLVVSFNGDTRPGYGITCNGDFVLNAPNKRALIMGNRLAIFFQGSSPNERYVNGLNAVNNAYQGIYESSATGVRMTVENAIIGQGSRQALWIDGAAAGDITLRNVTIGPATLSTYEPVRFLANNANLVVENGIFLGNANQNVSNIIHNAGAGLISFTDSAVVTTSTLALSTVIGENAPFLNPDRVSSPATLSHDPAFINITDPLHPYYFAVSSPIYATAGTGGTPIHGGAPLYNPTEEVVTVSKTAGADFSTIQAAIDSLTLDFSKKYIVRITDSAVYDEEIRIKVPLTLEGGSDTNRPILAVRNIADGFDQQGVIAAANCWSGDAGLLIDLPINDVWVGVVGLKNLVIIPSKHNPTPPAMGVTSMANNIFVDFDNVVVTGNDGNDAPISTTGEVDVPVAPEQVFFSGAGVFLGSYINGRTEGNGMEARLINTVITHNKVSVLTESVNVYRGGLVTPGHWELFGKPTVVPFITSRHRHVSILDGCRFTSNGGQGVFIKTSSAIVGKDTPVYFVHNRLAGIQIASRNGTYIDGVVSARNGQNAYAENSMVGRRGIVKNAILADSRQYNVMLWNGTASQTPNYFENVTVSSPRHTIALSPPLGSVGNHPTILVSGSASGGSTMIKLFAKDSIFAGHGNTAQSQNLLWFQSKVAGSEFTMDHVALVQAGDFRLNTPPFNLDGPTIVNGTEETSADPQFVNTTDPFHEDYYAVGNPDYSGLASDGTRLIGGGRYVPLTNVADWSMY